MGSVARERRRSRNSSTVVGSETSPADKPEDAPRGKGDRSGAQSHARAKRRARLLELELKQHEEMYLPLANIEGSDVNFELLKHELEANSWAWDDEEMGPGSGKREGVTVSHDIDESKRQKTSTARLNKMKSYLYHKDSLEVMKGKTSENYKRLYRPSLEKLLLTEVATDDETATWPPGKENYSDVKVLATLLPDEILSDIRAVDPKEFHAAVLFADISGFTELCQKFDKTGKGGPSRLSEILNTHIGAMIEIVLSRNGDVCKFGGDAILCFWKASSETDLKNAVSQAIDAALDIQKKCQTDAVGLSIRIKIAISAGQVMFSTIGDSYRKYYLIVGKPVLDTNRSEKLCRPGDLIVTPNAWKYVSPFLLYSYLLHPNQIHILVQGFGPLWNRSKLKVMTLNEEKLYESGVRQSLRLARNLKLEDIRPFVLPFVMKCVDHNEPLDYLTEMRQVAIVFLKFDINGLGLSSRDTIELCDRAYRSVCRIADRADGIVNKMTSFDKDVSLLVVFGLRGFKCDLASKSALKCAYGCVEKLRAVSEVDVSAGVTTGMAYCGVIGHLLRREYTVMGLPVNKAARLMCTYENIVSCDRETFLQSKLQSAHFVVLEKKPLKGIPTSGPIYEFSLSIKRRPVLDVNGPPLLGRSKEIAEFKAFIEDYMMEKRVNFFVVYGGARMGKTKLISTLARIVERFLGENSATTGTNFHEKDKGKESGVDICFISLTEDDYRTSYSTVRLIFQPALGFSESSTPEEREEKILMKLGELKDPHVLATLNTIFNVQFNLTSNYLSMQEEEQLAARRIVKKKLFKACFPSDSKWLIVIDDAEFMDEDSWGVLKWWSTISNYPLFLMTVGQQRALSPYASECLLSIPHKKVILTELDKWFYTALACQILEVKAIPVQLESLLQRFKSSGNPGWLECYLLSLLQTDCLQISYVTKREMNKMKLVTAAEDSLTVGKKHCDGQGRRESVDWAESLKLKEPVVSDIVPVCVLGPHFKDAWNDPELTMDIMYVKAIDKLKPLEQLILKAGSVLGVNFRRDALYYLITMELVMEERTFAKAIKNLFEMRLISCDKGDFTCPSTFITNRKTILSDNFQKDIKCNCIGLTKSDALQNYPDYAACGFMRFKSSVFRDTVYNLLLNEQKKKFHYHSIMFIRNNTYRCKACHNVLFDHVVGLDMDKEITLVCMRTPMHGVRSTRVISPKPSEKSFLKKAFRSKANVAKVAGRDHQTALSTNELFEESVLLNRDITECQCPQILCSVYADLLEHSERAGRRDIMLEVYFEYASVSLTSNNMPLTAKVLEETQTLAKAIKDENEYPGLCTPFVFAKIHTLTGATNLSMGMSDTALRHLETALKHFGKKVPRKRSEIELQIRQSNLTRRLITEWFGKRFVGRASDKWAAYFDLLSECLSLMCMVHMYGETWNLAKLTSSWALNSSLRSYRDFFALCTSCANMMDVAYHYNDKLTSWKMEKFAIDICEHCSKQALEGYELEAVARLCTVMFRTRQLRAEIEGAISFGFKAIRIASVIRHSRQRLDLMPELIFALMQRSRLSEAVSLLQELEFASAQHCDRTGRMWYYALCMDFQLDTGYTILPYKACEQFVNQEEENFGVIRSLHATERLCTSMWLWCVRNGEWDLSKRYAALIRHRNLKGKLKTPTSVYTKLKKLEGLLVTLADNLDNRRVHASESVTSDILTVMKALKKGTKIVPLLKPRYLLLEAYYACIKGSRRTGEDTLRRARALAEKIGDKNTFDWIVHNKLVWRNAATSAQKSFWLDHCRYGNFVDWHEAESAWKKEAVMYSLPLPNNNP